MTLFEKTKPSLNSHAGKLPYQNASGDSVHLQIFCTPAGNKNGRFGLLRRTWQGGTHSQGKKLMVRCGESVINWKHKGEMIVCFR